MKKYTQYIKENTNPVEEDILKNEWFNAIYNNDINKVKELIKNGIDINIQNYKGETALIIISTYENIEIFEILLNQRDININIQECRGYTPLMRTVLFKNFKEFNILLKRPDIDINIKNKFNQTVLMIASHLIYPQNDEFGISLKMLKKLLIRKDVDINILVSGEMFIYYIQKKDKLKDYSLQKRILDNDREDLILFDKYELVVDEIKEEYPELFKAKDWGLVG
jgi:ankyrin repeat protein